MANFAYVNVIGNLKKFMNLIQTSGVPPKVTNSTLSSLGLKSSNDRAIIPVLKYLQFITADGTPTELWRRYRDKTVAKVVLGQAIANAYSELFGIYPDAYRKDTEAVRNFFSANSALGAQATNAMAQTFKALCELATFQDEDASGSTIQVSNMLSHKPPQVEKASVAAATSDSEGNGRVLAVNINIELQLPATNDADVYDKLFEALERRLLRA